jgi:hypothetical protein
MRHNRNRALVWLSIITIIIFCSCSNVRYATDFKHQKKQIDTLTILNTYALINTYKGIDSALIDVNTKIITNTAYGYLNKKYKLLKSEQQNFNYDSIFLKLKDIDKTKGTISNGSVENIFANGGVQIECRYALLLLYYGTYNPDFEPDFNVKYALTHNAILINSPAKVSSDIVAIIIDYSTREIVYYNRINSSPYDPRSVEDLSNITRYVLESFIR